MPDVTGLRLADAQARLSAQGYPTVEPIDATGHGRPVLDPTNWIVQSQSPAPGTRGVAVTLRVRKPTDAAGVPGSTWGVVPEVVCLDLQHAQDALQAAGFVNSPHGTPPARIAYKSLTETGWSSSNRLPPAAHRTRRHAFC